MSRIPVILSLLVSGVAFAESPAADATAADATATVEWNPTAEQQAVYKALLVRHDAPSCDALDGMSADPVDTYRYLVDHASQPAWVAMRAARCLMVNHPDAAKADMQRWVTDPQAKGLAILTMTNLDALPLPIATELATLALTDGPDPDAMRKRIQRAENPQIQAIADLPLAPATAPSAAE